MLGEWPVHEDVGCKGASLSTTGRLIMRS